MQTPKFGAVLRNSGRRALQWRLLALWLGVLLIPTALLSLPFWQILSAQLDHSVHAADLAQRLNMNSLNDLVGAVMLHGTLVAGMGMLSLLLTLLLSPFLSGAAICAARATEAQTFGNLVHGGITEYWRMARMLLWAIVPLGIAAGIGGGLLHLADLYSEKAILESDADLAHNAAWLVFALLFLIAQATVDAGRAQFALSVKRRSALKAWWRGCKNVLQRPFANLGLYFALTLSGLAMASLLGILRINVPHAGGLGFIVGLVFTQLAAAALAGMRNARLFALAEAAKAGQ